MIFRFIDRHNGEEIEVDTDKKVAYFKSQDYEAPMNKDWEFSDWFACRYRILMRPDKPELGATLQQLTWKDRADAKPEPVHATVPAGD
jgi:hypothetical protein